MKKILFIVNHLAFFSSHRSNIVELLLKKNYKSLVVAGQPASKIMEEIAINDLKRKKINFRRVYLSSFISLNIFKEFLGLVQICYQIIKFKPNIVHAISPKIILISIIINKFLSIKNLILAISGMGNLFVESKSIKYKILKKIYIFFLKTIRKSKNITIIVQNNADKLFFEEIIKLSKNQIRLIKGSGVETKKFSILKKNEKKKIILLSSRLVVEKGIKEFVSAARILKYNFPEWKFVIVGASDYSSSSMIKKNNLNKIRFVENIEWLGYVKNMNKMIEKSSIICLPSYREGLSKSLIEGAMMGKPIITTLAPGCKDTIIKNITGFAVPVKSIFALVTKLRLLMSNEKLRDGMGVRAKIFAQNNFSSKKILKKIYNLYKQLEDEK